MLGARHNPSWLWLHASFMSNPGISPDNAGDQVEGTRTLPPRHKSIASIGFLDIAGLGLTPIAGILRLAMPQSAIGPRCWYNAYHIKIHRNSWHVRAPFLQCQTMRKWLGRWFADEAHGFLQLGRNVSFPMGKGVTTLRNLSSHRRAKPAQLPFSGLGLDLEPVLIHAATLRLRPLATVESAKDWSPATMRVTGYELQIRLGRETRAG